MIKERMYELVNEVSNHIFPEEGWRIEPCDAMDIIEAAVRKSFQRGGAVEEAAQKWINAPKPGATPEDLEHAAVAAVEIETHETYTAIGTGDGVHGPVVLLERAEQHRIVEFNIDGTLRKVLPAYNVKGNARGEVEEV
jgi:hypothetical protein